MMEYRVSTDIFYSNMFVKEGTELRHQPGKCFNLFPFIANNNAEIVTDLTKSMGRYLCKIQGIETNPITSDELVEVLKEDTEIDSGYEGLFKSMIVQLFFDNNDEFRPLNLKLIMQTKCDTSGQKKTADYLVDVLGDKKLISHLISESNESTNETSNVLEQAVFSKLGSKKLKEEAKIPYFQITNAIQKCFEDDITYVLENQVRVREYLQNLLEFYYFEYTSQACLQLNRFMDGERNTIIPLYYCLEWEKTNQNRPCFTQGWSKLQRDIKRIFAHAIVLEILNQTDPETERVDYIRLKEMIVKDPDLDAVFANQISELTDCYRDAINDCPEMTELERTENSFLGETETEIKYLFDNIKTQFEQKRNRPYTAYANHFEAYCDKFLKRRGRSGKLLSISEEMLIFLTKICIKNEEKMRLKDVFLEFEKRGVFLDSISKDNVTDYYEKLNLIEKKSDSGDAKYVKRIL